MPAITNFNQAHDALREYYDYSRTPYTLDTMQQLMSYLGDPQEKVKVVHVAGTSGKTSTSYYCSALLVAAGQTAGLFVSPHVDEVNERLQINGQLLPESEYCAILSEFLTLLKDCPVKPSYFELLAAMAFWDFARRGLDYAVMEVGLGGLLDATNVVARSDKVCLITDIGLDHTEILGNTLAKIAAQKAGIVQAGNQVFMYAQNEEVMQSVQQSISYRPRAVLHELPGSSAIALDSLPLFQQRNLGLAVAAIQYVLMRDASRDLSDTIVEQASAITIPARLERFSVQGKTVVVDGSHNQQKIETLLASIDQLYPGTTKAVVCAFVAGNDSRWQQAIGSLHDQVAFMIFTTFQAQNDLPKSSVTAAQIAEFCSNKNIANYVIHEQPAQAYAALLERPESLLLITGSFYLLNSIRPLIGGK